MIKRLFHGVSINSDTKLPGDKSYGERGTAHHTGIFSGNCHCQLNKLSNIGFEDSMG